MFSQTNLTTRRQFLERSAWGIGSTFLLPGLLQSCMQDHIIPDPTKPPTEIPLLGDAQIDWNDDAKTVVSTALGLIPEAGEILSGLVDIFWPKSGEDVWGKVKNQVEALVQQDLTTLVYQQVSDKLGSVTPTPGGLIGRITLYLNYLKTGTPSEIRGAWMEARGAFTEALPAFQEKGYELPLLGLFSQFANLYLGLLRDPLLPMGNSHSDPNIIVTPIPVGISWGMTQADIEQLRTDLKNTIAAFTAWPNDFITRRQISLKNSTKPNDTLCEPFKTVNAYVRDMTFMVLDFRDMWPYFDVTKYPNGSTALLTREIYSDPYGSCNDSGSIEILTSGPTQRPTQITVWGYDRIDAAQLTYPANSGPGGVTTTLRMGDLPDGNGSGGTNQPPHGGVFTNTLGNPIIAGRAITAQYQNYSYVSNPILAQLQFLYNDNTTTNLMGSLTGAFNKNYNDSGWIGYPYEALSSILINGVNKRIGSADSIVFGFTFWKSPAAQVDALRDLYVKSPKERSVSDFVQTHPGLAIPAGLITDELKAARKAYWADIEARAKALK